MQSGLRAFQARGQIYRDLGLDELLIGLRRAQCAGSRIHCVLQLFDVPFTHDIGIAGEELLPRVELVLRLLQCCLRLLGLGIGNSQFALGQRKLSLDFDQLLLRGHDIRFLARAVELENRVTCLDVHFKLTRHEGFDDPAGTFRQYRNCPECRNRRGCRWMKIENQRDQGHGQHQAQHDAVAQLEPDRIERYFPADALALHISADQIVGQYGEKGTEQELKHVCSPVRLSMQWNDRLELAVVRPTHSCRVPAPALPARGHARPRFRTKHHPFRPDG